MKKLTYLFAFFALSFGLSINAQSSLDDLTDAKSGGANFTSSLILGHANTATQQKVNQNTFVGYGSGQDIVTGITLHSVFNVQP